MKNKKEQWKPRIVNIMADGSQVDDLTGYVIPAGHSYYDIILGMNMPTQRSMDLKLFEIKETNVQHADGHISVNKTPKVTGKGQQYFINKFLSEDEVAG